MTGFLNYPNGATPLDPDEISGLIPSHISNQGELNEAEQSNILNCHLWAASHDHRNCLTDTFSRLLHKRMFGLVWRWAGRYRQTEKNIGVAPHHISASVRVLCEDTKYWIDNHVFPWDEIGARFHHRLVSVHSFPNGNGRHARLLTDILLKTNGQRPFFWGAPGDQAELGRDGDLRKAYIDALREADGGRFEKLFAFVRQ